MGLTARLPELLDHGGDGKLSRQKAGNLMAALGTVKILLSLADGDQQVCNCSYLGLCCHNRACPVQYVISKGTLFFTQPCSWICLLQSSAGTAVAVAQKLMELSVLEQLLELGNASSLPVRVQASCQTAC